MWPSLMTPNLTTRFFLQCRLHGETLSMFCTLKKSLLCVKCFRELPLDGRMHCVDLETAYNHGAKKLDKALTVSNNHFFHIQGSLLGILNLAPLNLSLDLNFEGETRLREQNTIGSQLFFFDGPLAAKTGTVNK